MEQERLGQRRGAAVIRRHEDLLTLLEVDPRELQDADTPEALAAIRAEAAEGN